MATTYPQTFQELRRPGESTLTNDPAYKLSSVLADISDLAEAMQRDLRTRAVSVLAYGAEGDGLTDDTAAIQAAIDDAAGRPVVFPAGDYRITASLTLPEGTELLGAGIGRARIWPDTSTSGFRTFVATGAQSAVPAAISGDVAEGARSLTLATGGVAALGLAEGDLVLVAQKMSNQPFAQVMRIREIDGEDLTFYEPLANTFTASTALTGTVSKSGTTTLTGSGTAFETELSVGDLISVPGTSAEVRVVAAIADDESLTVNTAFTHTASGQAASRLAMVAKVTPVRDLKISGFSINGTNAEGTFAHGLWLVNVERPMIRDIKAEHFNGDGILIFQAYAPMVGNVYDDDCGTMAPSAFASTWYEYVTGGIFEGLHSERASGFGPTFHSVTHSAMANVVVLGPTGRSVKESLCAYNNWTNVTLTCGDETGFSITTGTHDETIDGLLILDHPTDGTGSGLWIGDGAAGGDLPSYNNVVKAVRSRFNTTNYDVNLDADSHDNVVELANGLTMTTNVTNLGENNLIKGPRMGQRKRVVGVNQLTYNATDYTTVHTNTAKTIEMAVEMTPSGGILKCSANLVMFHPTVGDHVWFRFELDNGTQVGGEVIETTKVANCNTPITLEHDFTGVSANTSHTVRLQVKVSNGSNAVTLVGANRRMFVEEGQIA